MCVRFKERKPCVRSPWRYTGGDYRDLLGQAIGAEQMGFSLQRRSGPPRMVGGLASTANRERKPRTKHPKRSERQRGETGVGEAAALTRADKTKKR